MKRKLLRTLLVAATLLVGANAWADDTNPVWSENYESYTDISQISSSWTNNGSNYQATLELCSNQYGNSSKWLLTYSGNSSRQTTEYFMFASAYTGRAYRFDAKLNLNCGNNNSAESRLYFMNGSKSGTNANPSNYLFYIGVNSSGIAYVSNGTDSETSTIGGLSSGTNSIAAQKWSKTYRSTGWFDASCIIDLEQEKVKVTLSSGTTNETFTISLKSGTKQLSGLCVLGGQKIYGVVALDDLALYELTYPAFTLASDAVEPTVGDNATVNVSDIIGAITVSSSDESIATASYDNGVVTINGIANGVANITVKSTSEGVELEKVITATVGTVATTNVTVNYLSGGSSIANPLTITDVAVGTTLTASEITYESVLYGAGFRYVNPVPDQTIPYTVVENGVININYTAQAAVTNVKKVVKAGETQVSSTDVAQDGKYVGDVIYFSFPAYINYNGTLYNKANNSGTYYSQSFTLTGTDQECVLSYTVTDKTNVVYYAEGEDVMTNRSTTGNITIRSSNQAAGYSSEDDVVLTNIPAGKYKITGNFYKNNASGGATWKFNAGDMEIFSFTIPDQTMSNGTISSSEFTLTSSANIIAVGGSTDRNAIDYIYIQKTGDVITKTSSANLQGFKTFYNADKAFQVDDNTTIYTAATPNRTTVTITPVNGKIIPAGKPVILKTTNSDDYKIVLTETNESSTDDFSSNVLQAATASGDIDGAYILAYTNADGLGFYPYAGSLDAGDVYLTAANAAHIRIVFDDDTVTGISNVKDADSENGAMFNLSGQRVNNGYKGIVIKNGKKYLVK